MNYVWRKSSYSISADCLEVRKTDDWIEVRDSKERFGQVLRFTQSEWRAFLAGAKDNEFDI